MHSWRKNMGQGEAESVKLIQKKSVPGCRFRIALNVILLVLVCVSDLDTTNAQDDDSLENTLEYINNTYTNTSGIKSSILMNETLNWEDENWRRGDKSRIAAIAVYCIIIVMALVGVGVRYFITQYEVSQANAQLEYQQLRNVR